MKEIRNDMTEWKYNNGMWEWKSKKLVIRTNRPDLPLWRAKLPLKMRILTTVERFRRDPKMFLLEKVWYLLVVPVGIGLYCLSRISSLRGLLIRKTGTRE